MTPSLRATLTARSGETFACVQAQAHARDRRTLIPCPDCRPVTGAQFDLFLAPPATTGAAQPATR